LLEIGRSAALTTRSIFQLMTLAASKNSAQSALSADFPANLIEILASFQ